VSENLHTRIVAAAAEAAYRASYGDLPYGDDQKLAWERGMPAALAATEEVLAAAGWHQFSVKENEDGSLVMAPATSPEALTLIFKAAEMFKVSTEKTESDKLLERTVIMMFRICNESVPLFSSQRLQGLHGECGKLLSDIRAYQEAQS